MMYIAIFNDKNRLTGKLCKWVTGLADYHIGFTDLTNMWDQDLLMRKRRWNPPDVDSVTLFETPFSITAEELDQLVFADVARFCQDREFKDIYGYTDYLGFLLRKMGFTPPNYGGVICSGLVRDIGYSKGFTLLGTNTDLEPSPADWRRKLLQVSITPVKQGRMD